MKKLLTVLALVAFSSTVMAATSGTSRIETFVNKKIAPITQKEKDLNSKVEAQQKAAQQKQAEAKKQQEANKKALEEKKQAVKNKQTETKKAVENEKNFWKNLFKF